MANSKRKLSTIEISHKFKVKDTEQAEFKISKRSQITVFPR